MKPLDELDHKIIDLLMNDSRISFRKIAKELDVSSDTIMRRFHDLEKNYVIQPTITVNLEKLGYEAMAFFGIKVSSQKALRQITNAVGRIPDITAVMETTGEYDLTVIANVRSIRHVFKIGEEIMKVDGVRRASIHELQLPFVGEATFPPKIWHNLDINSP
jgi:Lrp/AsnC family transcriptional regulator, regulator for asnA, asnC and gidA